MSSVENSQVRETVQAQLRPEWLQSQPETGFCHQALFYEGSEELVGLLARFVRAGLTMGDKVFVMLSAPKLRALQVVLGRDAGLVDYADMDLVGVNPARMIPLWASFAEQVRPGQRARGVGEPVTGSRRLAELVECQLHESLLNVAFEKASSFWLLCPYETGALAAPVLDEARRSHAFVASRSSVRIERGAFTTAEPGAALAGEELAEPPAQARRFGVDASSMASARQLVRARAGKLGLGADLAGDFALAVHEVIANSLKHGGGQGEVALWSDSEAVICEVSDKGYITDALVGRRRPTSSGESGRGLWMANQLCDLVQIRTGAGGTRVRLHMRGRA